MAEMVYQRRDIRQTGSRTSISQRQTGGKILEDNRESAQRLKQFMSSSPAQRMTEEEKEPLQGKFAGEEIAQLEQQPALKPNNTGLPDNLKSSIESLSGMSMDNVKVHYNSSQLAQLNALAYAQGTDIHLAPGQEQHLPHEAWHVVQQVQGRVKPTMQMKGVAINNDEVLEREADLMGEKAQHAESGRAGVLEPPLTSVNYPLQNAGILADLPLQGKFVSLSEERIIHIQAKAKERGEDLETGYMEGLLEKESDKEHNADNPDLYVPIIEVTKQIANLDTTKSNERKEWLYAKMEEVTAVQDKAEEEIIAYLKTGIKLYRRDESGPITAEDIKVFMETNKEYFLQSTADAIQNNLVFFYFTGGQPEVDDGGYGAIEFRFKHPTGTFYVLASDYEHYSWLGEKYPHLVVKRANAENLETLKELYKMLRMPYPEERIWTNSLYVEGSIGDLFKAGIRIFNRTGKVLNLGGKMAEVTAPLVAPAPAPPAVVPKTRSKTYTGSAPRGSRGTGQAAAMGGLSAKNYVALFNNNASLAHSWEWLHLQGARLGGPNRPENLVAGTDAANTQMIPYERSIYSLSKIATPEKPVKVDWSATVKQDSTNHYTHIGRRITMSVSFPRGKPDVSERGDPAKLAAGFPITFNVLEGANFTKFDRDAIEANKGNEI